MILAAGATGGLSQAELASWIFGVFALNGILTIAMSLAYRQPLGFFWTIPGTILVGGSLTHLSWAEVVGAFFVTAALITVLGVTGLVRRVMEALPMPIVMAMVAGVFLSFGTNLVKALGSDFAIAVPMIVVFLLLSTVGSLGRWMPPILGALLAGAAAVAFSGRFEPDPGSGSIFAAPVFTHRCSPGPRSSNWCFPSRSPSSSYRTGRASPCCARPDTTLRSTSPRSCVDCGRSLPRASAPCPPV